MIEEESSGVYKRMIDIDEWKGDLYNGKLHRCIEAKEYGENQNLLHASIHAALSVGGIVGWGFLFLGFYKTDSEIMDKFTPQKLEENVEVFDHALNKYLAEYEKAGICPKHFESVTEFVEDYNKEYSRY